MILKLERADAGARGNIEYHLRPLIRMALVGDMRLEDIAQDAVVTSMDLGERIPLQRARELVREEAARLVAELEPALR